MKKLRLGRAARKDLSEIQTHIIATLDDPRHAHRVREMLIAQCEHLAALSGTMGRARDDLRPGLRSFPFRGFIIFFQYAEDRLEIVNILSGRRDLESHIDDD